MIRTEKLGRSNWNDIEEYMSANDSQLKMLFSAFICDRHDWVVNICSWIAARSQGTGPGVFRLWEKRRKTLMRIVLGPNSSYIRSTFVVTQRTWRGEKWEDDGTLAFQVIGQGVELESFIFRSTGEIGGSIFSRARALKTIRGYSGGQRPKQGSGEMVEESEEKRTEVMRKTLAATGSEKAGERQRGRDERVMEYGGKVTKNMSLQNGNGDRTVSGEANVGGGFEQPWPRRGRQRVRPAQNRSWVIRSDGGQGREELWSGGGQTWAERGRRAITVDNQWEQKKFKTWISEGRGGVWLSAATSSGGCHGHPFMDAVRARPPCSTTTLKQIAGCKGKQRKGKGHFKIRCTAPKQGQLNRKKNHHQQQQQQREGEGASSGFCWSVTRGAVGLLRSSCRCCSAVLALVAVILRAGKIHLGRMCCCAGRG